MKWVKDGYAIADRILAINGTIRIFIEEFMSLAVQRGDKISLRIMSVLSDEAKYLCDECGMCEHFYTPVESDIGVFCAEVDGAVLATSIPCEHFVKRSEEG